MFRSEPPDAMGEFIAMLLSVLLPTVLLFGMLMFFMRRMNKGGGVMGVGKNRARTYVQRDTGITFKNVAGEDEAKESLQEVVDFLHNPEKYTKIGAKLPKGALLVGPPWNRQDTSGQGGGRRSACAVFLPVRFRVCGNVCGRGRIPCAGSV